MLDLYYHPPAGFHFKVTINNSSSGTIDGSFQEVSGILAEIKTEDVVEGGENRFVYRLPQSTQYAPLVLKRGLVTRDSELNKWCSNVIQSDFLGIQTKSIVIHLLDQTSHEPLMSWNFINAYPVKFEVSGFNAQQSEIVVETLQFAYTRFEKLALGFNPIAFLRSQL
jgi:phage tail-like protein